MIIPHEAPETGLASSYHTAIIWITFITFCSGLRVCDCAIKEIASGAKLYHQIPQRSTFDIFVPCQAVAKGGLNNRTNDLAKHLSVFPWISGCQQCCNALPTTFPGTMHGTLHTGKRDPYTLSTKCLGPFLHYSFYTRGNAE